MLKAIVVGNIGSEPELRYSASGQAVLRFNVASNGRTRNQAGEWVDETAWIRVTILGQRAESLGQYLRKGTKVYADGRLEARPWTDRENQVRAGLELLANDVEFMSPRQDDQAAGTVQPGRPMPERQAVGAGRGSQPAPDEQTDLEDLPF